MNINMKETLLPWIGKTAKILGIYIIDKMNEKGIDLTKEQWVLLKVLHEEDGQMQNSLADITERNKASLTRLVHTLEKKNFIARIPSKEDKRINQIFLTKRGREVFAETQPIMQEIVEEVQGDLSETELNAAMEVLMKIQENIVRKIK